MKSQKKRSNATRSFQTSDIEEFCALWMPFEVEILRLAAGHDANEAGEDVQDSATNDPQRRRYLLEKLFEDREQGTESAKKTMSAFSQVLQQILSKTQAIIENDEHRETAPGTVALQQLTNDPTFLRRAGAYSVSFQNWLIDYVQRNSEQSGFPATNTSGDGSESTNTTTKLTRRRKRSEEERRTKL